MSGDSLTVVGGDQGGGELELITVRELAKRLSLKKSTAFSMVHNAIPADAIIRPTPGGKLLLLDWRRVCVWLETKRGGGVT